MEVTATLEKEGRQLCALVNNAGISGMDKTRTLDIVGPEHYLSVLGTNVVGMARATDAFLPMLQQCPGARIVNVGSYFGDLAPGLRYIAPYVASKFAVEGLTDVWRRSLASSSIAVSLIKPGDFSTRMKRVMSCRTRRPHSNYRSLDLPLRLNSHRSA